MASILVMAGLGPAIHVYALRAPPALGVRLGTPLRGPKRTESRSGWGPANLFRRCAPVMGGPQPDTKPRSGAERKRRKDAGEMADRGRLRRGVQLRLPLP